MLAMASGDAITWNDLLIILAAIALVLLILFLLRRT